jgi:hypothetical protein
VRFSRDELKDLWNALGNARAAPKYEQEILNDLISYCDGISDPDEVAEIIHKTKREEETVEDLKNALWQAKRLLPKVSHLFEGISEILYSP